MFMAGSASHKHPTPQFSKVEIPGDVAELADALDLGSSAARREGSNPSVPTQNKTLSESGKFLTIKAQRKNFVPQCLSDFVVGFLGG